MILYLIRKLLVALGYPRLETSTDLVGPWNVGALQKRIPESTACQIFYPTDHADALSQSSKEKEHVPYFRQKAVQGLIDYLRLGDGLLQMLSDTNHPCLWRAEPAVLSSSNNNDDGFPLVLFSHGLAGTYEMYTELCQHLASLGYCVVALEHEDGSAAFAEREDGTAIPYIRPNDEPYSREKVLKFRTPMLHQRVQELEKVIQFFRQAKTQKNQGDKENMHAASSMISSVGDDDDLLSKVIEVTDPYQLHLVGHSFGGATQMLATQQWTSDSVPDNPCQPKSLMVMDAWAFALEQHVLDKGLDQRGDDASKLCIISIICESWETNPERTQILEFLENSKKSLGNTVYSFSAKNAVHQSFSDTEAWFPSCIAHQVQNRGKGENRHVTIRSVAESWAQMINTETRTPSRRQKRHVQLHNNKSCLKPWFFTCILLVSCMCVPSAVAFQCRYLSCSLHQTIQLRSTTNRSVEGTWLQSSSKNDNAATKGSFSFSGINNLRENLVSSDNPLDQLLAWLSSDVFSIALGSVGLLAVIIHRLALLDDATASADMLTYETRADLLAVFACGSVLLNGLTQLDVTTALAESVDLDGIALSSVEIQNENSLENLDSKRSLIVWAMDSLLLATPAKTAVLLRNDDRLGTWRVHIRAGTVPATNTGQQVPEKSPILDRVGSLENVKETYLPTLQSLPGRFEFTYLPLNTQLALLIPIPCGNSNSVLVLGSNRSKSFSPRDIAWSRVIANKIGESL